MRSLFIRLVFVLSAAILMALSGQTALYIPGLDIPITWQSMVAMLLPLAFPALEACLGIAVFLVAGALGAPVFANAQGGYEVFLSSSGGYLLGFMIVSIISALAKPYLTREHVARPLTLFLSSHVLLSILGVLWILIVTKGDVGLSTHFLPFLTGIIIKSFMAWGLFVVIRITASDFRNKHF